MKLPIILMITLFSVAGCSAKRMNTELDRHFNVFGVALNSRVDYRVINDEAASEEPCLRGYERSFDRLGISIGYGFDARVRRITTRNPATALFGIRPGMTAAEGKRVAQRAGLTEVADYAYQLDDISLLLLVDANGKVFGVTVENRDYSDTTCGLLLVMRRCGAGGGEGRWEKTERKQLVVIDRVAVRQATAPHDDLILQVGIIAVA